MSDASHGHSTALRVAGMTCASCELLLERKLRVVPGIRKVTVSQRKGTVTILADPKRSPNPEHILSVIHAAGYSMIVEETPTLSTVSPEKRKWMEIGACLLIVFALFKLLQIFDLTSIVPSTTEALSLGGVLLIGLIAGTSSCLAVTGGLLLSVAAHFNATHHFRTMRQKIVPLLYFNAGRLASYFVFGGLVGVLGTSVALSPEMTGYMNIAVAVVMLYLALKILHIVPAGIFFIRPPKRLSHWIAGLSESSHPAAPFTLGAMTFFLPCGFTQSLQLVALASGSFVAGALTMFVFALGTLPSLVGISALSSTARGNFSRLFLRFSGVLVLALALLNLNAGFTLAGIDLASVFAGRNEQETMGGVAVRDGMQEVAMRVTPYGYEPSDLVIRAGVPVRWIVDGKNASGCTSSLVIPSLNIGKILESGKNVIEFTPQKTGTLAFSCGMGMVRGRFTVI